MVSRVILYHITVCNAFFYIDAQVYEEYSNATLQVNNLTTDRRLTWNGFTSKSSFDILVVEDGNK